MSHFTVLVVGDDIEKQLQPFHEFECTGTNDQFVLDVDVTAECRNEGLDYYGLEDKTVTDEAAVDRANAHKYGFAVVNAAGDLVKVVRRTNPNKKWDWWQLGGRWSGFLKLKAEGAGVTGKPGLMGSHFAKGEDRADQATKGSIDFEGMREASAAKAAEKWDKAAAAKVAAGHAADSAWESWEKCRDVLHAGDIEGARKFYGAQPVMTAVNKALDFPWDGVDEFLTPREEYVRQQRDRAITTWAIVYRGEWSEKGSMGWFGMSSGDIPQKDWNRLFNEFIDRLPDDTLLSVVDCHI